MRAFCKKASGKIKEVDYVLVHHTGGKYESVAEEMDTLLNLKRTYVREVCCRKGEYKEV